MFVPQLLKQAENPALQAKLIAYINEKKKEAIAQFAEEEELDDEEKQNYDAVLVISTTSNEVIVRIMIQDKTSREFVGNNGIYRYKDIIDIESDSNDEPNLKDVKGLPELIVGIIDIFAATIAEAWTKTDDKSKYRLDEDEKEQLIKAWELYLKNSEEVKISPSTMLLLTTGIIYAPRIILAMNERKEQRMKQQQAAQEQQQ